MALFFVRVEVFNVYQLEHNKVKIFAVCHLAIFQLTYFYVTWPAMFVEKDGRKGPYTKDTMEELKMMVNI